LEAAVVPRKGSEHWPAVKLRAKPENWVGSVTMGVPSGKSWVMNVLAGTVTMYEWLCPRSERRAIITSKPH
jgi:hypothetical protein